jgi:hypothetical protein
LNVAVTSRALNWQEKSDIEDAILLVDSFIVCTNINAKKVTKIYSMGLAEGPENQRNCNELVWIWSIGKSRGFLAN